MDPGSYSPAGRPASIRAERDYVIRELDLRPGDVVVDIGAGDGWWAEHFANAVGKNGLIHAAEVDKKRIEEMQKKYAGLPQLRPYLCEEDSTCLPEASCDLAFLSQSYHHLPSAGRADYLRRLRSVLKATGRMAVIDKYSTIATSNPRHGTDLSQLVKEAEEAGWILVRYELLIGTFHYLAIFVQKDLFQREPAQREARRARI